MYFWRHDPPSQSPLPPSAAAAPPLRRTGRRAWEGQKSENSLTAPPNCLKCGNNSIYKFLTVSELTHSITC